MHILRILACWSSLLLCVSSVAVAKQANEPKDAKAVDAITRRIVIISIDGARPDLILRAKMPTIHALLPQSTFTFWARTTPHSITLPSHVSMLTGVVPRKHKVEWNEDLKLVEPVYPKFPTLFEVAKRAGHSTALVAGKAKFSVVNKPGTIDWPVISELKEDADGPIAEQAAQLIRSHQPEVLVVHFPGVDNAGHKYGWSSAEQMRAFEEADRSVAKLLATLGEMNLRDKTVVLITADHGGAGLTHLPDDPRARFIPWIIAGPGIREGLDLTIYPKTSVETEDTFATASFLLGVTRSPELDGGPIVEILEKPVELLRAE